MKVVAKFKLLEKTERGYANGASIVKQAEFRFVPVWEENGVNRRWSEATPSGELKMVVTNPAAIDAFDVGADYFLAFHKADPAKPDEFLS